MDATRLRSWTAGFFTAGTLLALAGPAQAADAPQISGGRSVAGTPQVGEALASTATWTASAPAKVTYSWLRCTGMAPESCRAIGGARERTYLARKADQGAYLRSRVHVSNKRGWAWVLSAPTDAIEAASAPEPEPDPQPDSTGGVLGQTDERAALLDPFPVVRIRGWLTPAGARVRALTVRAPDDTRVAVSCAGRSCPLTSWSRAAALVHLRPFEVALRAGVRLTVRVTRPGWIGKHTVITVRKDKAPARRDRCLYPGRTAPRACPGA